MKTKGQLLYEAYCHKRVEMHNLLPGDDARDGGHEPGSIAEHLKQMHPEWDKLWDKRKRIWEGAAELFEQEQALREKA